MGVRVRGRVRVVRETLTLALALALALALTPTLVRSEAEAILMSRSRSKVSFFWRVASSTWSASALASSMPSHSSRGCTPSDRWRSAWVRGRCRIRGRVRVSG